MAFSGFDQFQASFHTFIAGYTSITGRLFFSLKYGNILKLIN